MEEGVQPAKHPSSSEQVGPGNPCQQLLPTPHGPRTTFYNILNTRSEQCVLCPKPTGTSLEVFWTTQFSHF